MEKKISFCIVAMNRLHHLKKTLLRNLKDNESYKRLEFVLLNYNSKDEMGVWVFNEFGEYIKNGRLVYYHTHQPLLFNHSHSKNIAFRLATGEIVCSINADHYAGKGFANYVNAAFCEDENIVLTPLDFHKTRNNFYPPIDVGGKVCVRKSDFNKIKGYDEEMTGYGFEDWDFINRLELIGVKRKLIEDFSYLEFISHGEEERYLLELTNLEGLYINYLTQASTEFIILYKDKKYIKGIIIENSAINSDNYKSAFLKSEYRFEHSLGEQGLEIGIWNEKENNLTFVKEDKEHFILQRVLHDLKWNLFDNKTKKMFHNFKGKQLIKDMQEFVQIVPNRQIMEGNLLLGKAVCNEKGFGKSILFKNYNYVTPITLM